MKLIVGLGNPGKRYAESRHNVGFMVVDVLAARWSIGVDRHESKFEGLLGDGPVASARCLLLKPMTFMNLSGRSVAAVQRFYKLDPADVLVIYDDIDLPLGQLRLRASGSAGGQKGMTDVVRHLQTDAIARLRIGIDRRPRAATTDHVLGRFSAAERETIDVTLEEAADAVQLWVRAGIAAAMNTYNRRAAAASRGDAKQLSEGEQS